MAADVHALVLEHLRAVRADSRDVRESLREQGSRLTRIKLSLTGFDKIHRIERRLDITD